MGKQHIAIGALVSVALAGGIYQGCLSATSIDEEALSDVIGPEPGPEMPALVPDAGPFPSLAPSIPNSVPPALADGPNRCGGLACPEGQLCCPSTGECFSRTCTDCCPLIMTAPELPLEVPSGEEPDLEVPPRLAE